jgi:hypothetical protein
MIILAAAAALASPAPPAAHPVSATARATATIRIIEAVRLKLDGSDNPGAPPVRDAVLRLGDGTMQEAKLIEFQ